MDNSQIEIQMSDNSLKDNHYWKRLISMFAMVGLKFEIHCWKEERDEIKVVLEFGKEKLTDWKFGTIVEGVVDDKFINMLLRTAKPLDTEIYNKMTPFFSIFFENGFSSEHYGTEFHILPAPINNTDFMALLKQLQKYAVITEF